MNRERRHFLKMAGYGFGGLSLGAMMERLALRTALADDPPAGNYKALVCIFLNGGNDANNMVIPISTTNQYVNYQTYYNLRNPNGLAIAQSALSNTMLSPNTTAYGTYAMHPNFANATGGNPLYPLWGQGKLAILANVGPLAQPITKQQYSDPTKRPYQLFSHSDQQEIWQTAQAVRRQPNGWGGRIADSIPPASPPIPMNLSVSGFPIFAAGGNSTPLVVASAPTALKNLLVINQSSHNADDTVRLNTLMEFTGIDLNNFLVNSASSLTNQTFGIAQYFNVDDPTFNTVFPNTTLGNQLKQVAKIMKVVTAQSLVSRQIFFCQIGGFDTHTNELPQHNTLYTQLSQALRAFYDATVEMSLASQVTSFTVSDFGRTMQPSGSGGGVGSDHGWGSHHLILGGAVKGKNFYGVRRDSNDPVTIFPTLQLGGNSDTDTGGSARGRWIPTVGVEQYGSTLAKWFGLDPSFNSYVFPNLGNFGTNDLGFMNAG